MRAEPLVSLVALDEGAIVGHILFSPVTVDGHPELLLMGLAPMAVAPEHQRRGIGSALVEAGLTACKALGATAVVVLGHPEYYPRFAFRPASGWGLVSEYDAPDEAFMALELRDGALRGVSGTVRYHPAFGELGEGASWPASCPRTGSQLITSRAATRPRYNHRSSKYQRSLR